MPFCWAIDGSRTGARTRQHHESALPLLHHPLYCFVRATLQEDRLSMTAAQAEQARLRAEQEAAQVGCQLLEI